METPHIAIAPLTAQDIAPCAALMATSEPWIRYGVDATAATALWTRALDAQEAAWVARCGHTMCGFAWYIERGAFGLSGYLKLLGVSRAARGHGVGTALLAQVERHALADGQDDVFLLVSHFNLPAQRFYERCAYHHVGAIPDYVRPGLTELIYRKRLRDGGE